MTENVRVRVSKWDLPDESHVSGRFEQRNDQTGLEGNSNIEKCSFDRSSARYAEGHTLSLSNAGGDKTCIPICKPGSESNGSGSEFLNYPMMDQSETDKKDDISGGPIVESKTELEGSVIKNSLKTNFSGVDSSDRDELWQNLNENKVSLTEGNTEKINSDWVPISSKVESEDGNVNNMQSVKCSDVDFVEKEKLLLTSDENKDGLTEGNNENSNSGWSPIPGKDESEDGNVNNLQNTKFSDVNFGDRDKSWRTSSEDKIDHNKEKRSGWGTSLGHIDNSSTSVRGWHRGTQSSPPKIRSRSRSRSRSPTQVHRREDKDSWNERNKSGPGFYRGPCRGFMAGRCTRGSLCRYLHEDGGGNSSDRLNRHGTDNREICDRETAIAHDNKEYLIESKEAAGSSLERFSSGKRSYDENREEHHDYRYKKPTVQCINFTRGKCFRGPACKFAHLNAPNDGAWHANDGERERGRGHDRAATRVHSEHDARHEPRRSIPCIFFPEGRCRNGDKCKFSHEGPVQSVPAGKLDDKSGSHGSNENASTWKGPRWGDAQLPNAQSNVSGWGGDNIQAIRGASYASNSSGTLSQPQGCDAKYSGLHSESQIVFPVKGQHHGYDTSHSHSVEGALVEQPADVKIEYNSHENSCMAVNNSSQYVRAGVDPYPVHSSDLSGQSHGNSRASTTNPINPGGHLHQFIPSISFGNDPSGLLNVPKAQSHYLGSQAPLNVANLGSSSQHPSFGGGQGQNIYSQPSTGEGQYPPLQPVGNVRGTGVRDQSQQATTQTGYAVQSSQENQLISNKGGIASSDGVSSNSKNTVTTEQMAQITNISASLAQILATGQQLPQLYAAHNPNAPGVPPMPQFSQPHSLMPMPCAAPAHQPQVDLLSQQHRTSIPSHIIPSYPGVAAMPSLIPSNSIEQNFPESAAPTRTPVPSLPTIGSVIGDHGGTNPEWRMNEIKTVEAEERNGLKENDIPSYHDKKEQLFGSSEGGGADPDIDKAGGKNMDKDAKGIRMFKYALVDQVKDMLKPIWKDGNMSKEVHKTIVKKVVDKVTGALQFNIPQTQERIDVYMEHSKGKLGKLVQGRWANCS